MSEKKLTKAEKIREWARFYQHLTDYLGLYRDYINKTSDILMHLADVIEKTQNEEMRRRP